MRRPAGFLEAACVILLLGLSIIACGSSGMPSTPTATLQSTATAEVPPTATVGMAAAIPSISAPAPEKSNTGVIFKVAVITDTLSEPVRREQAQVILEESTKLIQPFVPVRLEMVDFIEDGSGGTTRDIAGRYLSSPQSAGQNGILIFSFGDGGQAKLQDGFGFTLPGPAGYRNAFVSSSSVADQIYVAVVPYGLKYMPCGYGGSNALQSTTALDGECRNQTGTACVQQNGYSMCSNAVGNLYMSTPGHFVSSMIIHAFLHLFSPGGDKDNYATPECNARMGYPNGFFDLQESQYYNGICPFVYNDFLASYKP